jgi:hypothetical protein
VTVQLEHHTQAVDVPTWFAEVYAGLDGWTNVFSDGESGSATDWGRSSDPGRLASAALGRAPTRNVWFSVATRRENLGRRRGEAADCLELPALWADIDIAGSHHTSGKRYPDAETAQALLRALPLQPSAVVDSGNGLQPWWFLAEPLPAVDALPVLAAWRATWEKLAADLGCEIDKVWDVARVMRVPGTWNHKNSPPALVRVIEWNPERRYGLDDIEGATIEPPEAAERPEREPYEGPERPGDAFNRLHTGGEVLAAYGFKMRTQLSDGEQRWTRPDKDPSKGHSVVVYPDGHTANYSDTVAARWPAFEKERSFDPFGLYAALGHGGDLAAAASALRARGYGEPARDIVGMKQYVAQSQADPQSLPAAAPWIDPIPESWQPVDLGPVLDGRHEQPIPDLLNTADGARAFFYRGNVNGIHGDPAVGKSWLTLRAVAEVLAAGRKAMLLDYEANRSEVVARLRALAVAPDRIRSGLIYVNPNDPATVPIVQHVLGLITPDVDLVVIDSLGEAFGLDGIDENSDADVAPWLRMVARPIADAGPAVVLVDHATKAKDNPLFPSGSKRKVAAITGSSFLVLARQAPTRELAGVLTLTCAKDRHGNYRRGEEVASVDVTPYPDGGVTVNLHRTAPAKRETAEAKVATIARKMVQTLRGESEPLSSNSVLALVDVKGARDLKLAALEYAVRHGALSKKPGSRNAQLYAYVGELPEEGS